MHTADCDTLLCLRDGPAARIWPALSSCALIICWLVQYCTNYSSAALHAMLYIFNSQLSSFRVNSSRRGENEATLAPRVRWPTLSRELCLAEQLSVDINDTEQLLPSWIYFIYLFLLTLKTSRASKSHSQTVIKSHLSAGFRHARKSATSPPWLGSCKSKSMFSNKEPAWSGRHSASIDSQNHRKTARQEK